MTSSGAAATTADDVAAPTGPRTGRGHAVAVTAMVFVASLSYAVLAVNRFRTWRSATYDLVIFDQAVRSYAHGYLPVAIVKGVHNGFGPQFSVLGDHVSPVLVLLAPLYLVYDDPRTLLVAQACLLAAAVAPLWRFTRRELGVYAAYSASVAYALSWPVAGAVGFDFHEVAFAPVLFAVLFDQLSAYRRGHGRRRYVVLSCAALLLVKEDMGLAVAGVGLCLLLPSRGHRPGCGDVTLGLGCLLGGSAYTALATQVIIPAFGGRSDYYWSYDHLGASVPAVLWHVISQPGDALFTMVHPATKTHTMLLLLAVAGLTPLVSPYLAVTLPLIAERMLSESPGWWDTGAQYNAFVVIPLLCAGVDGAARIARHRHRHRRLRHAGTAWTAMVAVVAVLALPTSAFADLTRPSAWRQTDDMRAAQHAADRIPAGALVETASSLGPRLSSRTRVLLWDRIPRWAPWVIADVSRPQFPFCGLEDQRSRVDLLHGRGYRTVFSERGFVVLHDPDAVAELTAPPAPPCDRP